MQAGGGFASLLYGDLDFSGRVAATVYRKVWANASRCALALMRLWHEYGLLEQCLIKSLWCWFSMLDNSLSGGSQPRGYRYMSPAATAAFVQYRFGHGESLHTYSSSFHQQHYSIRAASLEAGASLNVTVTITATDETATGQLTNTTRIHSVLLFLNHTLTSSGTLLKPLSVVSR